MNTGREEISTSLAATGDLRCGRPRTVAIFCMRETGHFQRLRPLISGLVQCGLAVHVFTHCMFRTQVERAGGIFFDLFSAYSLEAADDESIPVPCRYVAFAAKYAEPVRRDVERIAPALVIHDTFALIGRLAADRLGIPRVNVCAGHNSPPARLLAALAKDPRVMVSRRCLRAAEVLRESYGLADASPFSYVSSLSPHLNIYCEPPEFLDEGERLAFEPVAFYGSLPSLDAGAGEKRGEDSGFGAGSGDKLKVYVSFGTIVWRYYAPAALRALTTLADALSEVGNVRAIVSLGGVRIESEARGALARPNVSIENYVDQWRILQNADAFVTHQGMNSTHEAICHRVPMISYPFFWDHPALAAKCHRFGLAIPLTESPRGEFGKDQVHAALARLAADRDSMAAALSRARDWEKAVLENRPSVHRRIIGLMKAG
jgi:MGT family glycosyltransferase